MHLETSGVVDSVVVFFMVCWVILFILNLIVSPFTGFPLLMCTAFLLFTAALTMSGLARETDRLIDRVVEAHSCGKEYILYRYSGTELASGAVNSFIGRLSHEKCLLVRLSGGKIPNTDSTYVYNITWNNTFQPFLHECN
jgi:hypothetical protein